MKEKVYLNYVKEEILKYYISYYMKYYINNKNNHYEKN